MALVQPGGGRPHVSRPIPTKTTGQTIIAGMGELHLEIIVDRLLREFKVEATVGKPQVAYKETHRAKRSRQKARYVRQTGGHGQYGHCMIEIEPREPGSGLRIRSTRSSAARSPRNIIPADRRGYSRGAPRAACWAVTKWWTSSVTLVDGSLPRGRLLAKWRSRLPAPWPLRRLCKRPIRALLEPMMKVEVVVPEEYMGDVIGDINCPPGPHRQAWTRTRGMQSIHAHGAA